MKLTFSLKQTKTETKNPGHYNILHENRNLTAGTSEKDQKQEYFMNNVITKKNPLTLI